jgi:hypothetical protein
MSDDGPVFDTGNTAADALLASLGHTFDAVLPMFNEDGGVEFISCVMGSGHAVTIAFVDAGDPPFVFTEESLVPLPPTGG